jgi:outer membrane protein
MRAVLMAATAVILASAGTAQADTLKNAAGLALSSNPGLQSERVRVDGLQERRVQARAQQRISASVDASAGLQSAWSANRTPGDDDFNYTGTEPIAGSVGVQQPLYTGGRARAAIDAADAQIAQGLAQLDSAESAVLLGVVQAFVDVGRDEEVVRIRQNNVRVLDRQREAAQARFEVGEITKTDVAQAEARLAGARTNLAVAQQRLAASRAAYARVVGEAPGTLEPPPAAPAVPETLEGALAEAERLSPQLAAARAQEALAIAAVRAAQAERRARATLNAGVSSNYDQGFNGAEAYGAALTARFSVPLFAGGALASREREARANEASARLAVQDRLRQVNELVTNAWQGLQTAQTAIVSSREQVRANETAFEGAELELQVGLRTTLDVLNQEQELLESRLALVSAERDAYVAAHALLSAIGALRPAVLGVDAPARATRTAAREALPFERPLIAVQDALERGLSD